MKDIKLKKQLLTTITNHSEQVIDFNCKVSQVITNIDTLIESIVLIIKTESSESFNKGYNEGAQDAANDIIG